MSRFVEPQHELFRRLNSSLSFDWRLGPYDVAQSRAHVGMLAARGIIESDDRDALLEGLEQVERELDEGSFPPTGPAISVSRRSIAMWMSSSPPDTANDPSRSSDSTCPSPDSSSSRSASEMIPRAASIAACAFDCATS